MLEERVVTKPLEVVRIGLVELEPEVDCDASEVLEVETTEEDDPGVVSGT